MSVIVSTLGKQAPNSKLRNRQEGKKFEWGDRHIHIKCNLTVTLTCDEDT